MIDSEALAIMRNLADGVKAYDQVVEVSTWLYFSKTVAQFVRQLLALLPYGGGLLYLSFALFHQKESVREYTVNLFNQLRAYPVSIYVSLMALSFTLTEEYYLRWVFYFCKRSTTFSDTRTSAKHMPRSADK